MEKIKVTQTQLDRLIELQAEVVVIYMAKELTSGLSKVVGGKKVNDCLSGMQVRMAKEIKNLFEVLEC